MLVSAFAGRERLWPPTSLPSGKATVFILLGCDVDFMNLDRETPLDAWRSLEDEIVACRRCPRLVAWREQVAETRRRAYRQWSIGAGQCRASATRVPVCWWWGWRQERTAQTARGACLPAMARGVPLPPPAPGGFRQPAGLYQPGGWFEAERSVYFRRVPLRAARQQAGWR